MNTGSEKDPYNWECGAIVSHTIEYIHWLEETAESKFDKSESLPALDFLKTRNLIKEGHSKFKISGDFGTVELTSLLDEFKALGHVDLSTFTLDEVKNIGSEVMNLGMDLRQQQLRGNNAKSGKQVLKEYFDAMLSKKLPEGQKLTDGVLIQLGFVKDKTDVAVYYKGDFEIQLPAYFKYKDCLLRKLKYVHELQNLFFALTGTELALDVVNSEKLAAKH